MKPFRFVAVIVLLFVAITLQSCGGGGSDKATNGSLTITTPTVTGPTGGIYTISETVTYTPPSGKVPNGLQVNVTIGGVTTAHYLDSTGSFTITDFVIQTSSSVFYSIIASTGDLTSSVGAVLAGFTPLNATPSPIVFASTDAAGTVKTSTVAGGLSPYAVSTVTVPSGSSGTASDISATIAGGALSVTKITLTGATQKSLIVTIVDANGDTLPILVLYY